MKESKPFSETAEERDSEFLNRAADAWAVKIKEVMARDFSHLPKETVLPPGTFFCQED